MGDFTEHVIFGFLIASVVSYFLKGSLNLTYIEALSSSIAIIMGSVLPDIDHKSAYMHRAAKSFASIGGAVLAILYLPLPLHMSFAAGATAFLCIYVVFSSIKMQHRGFTHSVSFLMTVSGTAIASSVIFLSSVIPGLAMGVGLLSHLILDRHFTLR